MDLSKISDIKLVGRAVKDRWEISPEMRRKVIDSLMTVLIAGEAREIVAACRVLASIDKMNVDLQNAAEQLSLEELKVALAVRLAQHKQEMEADKKLEERTDDAE